MTIKETIWGDIYVPYRYAAAEKPVNTVKTTPKQIKNGNKKLLLALGGLAVAGAVTAGIVLAVKKGKIAKNGNNVIKDVYNSVEEFRNAGTFNNGKAFINGKEFTGTICHNTKNGPLEIFYDNGLWKEVKDSQGIVKSMTYETDGVRKIFDRNKNFITLINPDKSTNKIFPSIYESVEEFRKVGTFNKGKAFKDGKEFTGTIRHYTENGAIDINYSNGLWSSSNDYSGNIDKYIKYNEDGTREIFNNIKHSHTIIRPDKSSVKTFEGNAFCPITYKEKNGTKIWTKILREEFKPEITDNKTTWQKIEDIEKQINIEDSNSFNSNRIVGYRKTTDLSTGKYSLNNNFTLDWRRMELIPKKATNEIKTRVKLPDGRNGKKSGNITTIGQYYPKENVVLLEQHYDGDANKIGFFIKEKDKGYREINYYKDSKLFEKPPTITNSVSDIWYSEDILENENFETVLKKHIAKYIK